MTKHTPGPWRIGDAGAAIFGPKTDAPSPATIVSAMGKAGGDVSAIRANARLIAAAPDLLDMCERLLGFAHHYAHESALAAGGGMLANAKALIAQAKGDVKE